MNHKTARIFRVLLFVSALILPKSVAGEAAPRNTLPAARTLTSADGRAMAGTILSKSDTAISFERAADKKTFEIPLEKLSDSDKAFVAGLIDGPGKAAPGKKASVLYVIAWMGADDYEKTHKEQVAWLKANGFDVTIGLKYYVKTKLAQIADETVIWLTPLALMDSYDIVWLQRFDRSTANKAEPTQYDFYQLTNHRNKQGGITVIRTWEDDKTPFLAFKPTALTRGPRHDRGSVVKNEGNWVFFWDKEDGAKDPKMGTKLLQEIEELLPEKKK
jgi:hypothetical protein